MAHKQHSLFAASRAAAQKIMDEPTIRVIPDISEEARVRAHLSSHGFSQEDIAMWFRGHAVITTAQRQLGIKR